MRLFPSPHPSPFVSFYQAFQLPFFFSFFHIIHIIHRWLIYCHLFLFFASIVLFFLLPSLIIDASHPCLLRHRSLLAIVTHPYLARASSSRFTTFPFNNTSRIAPSSSSISIPYRTKISMISLCAGVVIGLHSKDFLPGICACRFDRSPPFFEKFPLKCNKSGNLSSRYRIAKRIFRPGHGRRSAFQRSNGEGAKFESRESFFDAKSILAINAFCCTRDWYEMQD